ncbi:MAG: transcription antitermination factor NusB [Chloroflexi bacterium HGW-Chloroflexi-10]|nr:MAG: transcription antitermination factor NusB [Chloroflexi bacterium HGW-Chloroflexi-10]
MKARTKARGIALQVLYEYDMAGHAPFDSLAFRLEEEPIEEKLVEFISSIVKGIIPITSLLDELIAEHAPEWPMDQVAVIDRNILRIALWEFAVEKCTPVKVAINEAIELSKLFGADSTPRFVNGVLGSLAGKQNEIEQKILKFNS